MHHLHDIVFKDMAEGNSKREALKSQVRKLVCHGHSYCMQEAEGVVPVNDVAKCQEIVSAYAGLLFRKLHMRQEKVKKMWNGLIFVSCEKTKSNRAST